MLRSLFALTDPARWLNRTPKYRPPGFVPWMNTWSSTLACRVTASVPSWVNSYAVYSGYELSDSTLSTRFHKYDDILLTFCSRSPIILSILRREESCRERAHTESSSLRTKGSSSKLSRDNIRHRIEMFSAPRSSSTPRRACCVDDPAEDGLALALGRAHPRAMH